MAHVIGLWEGYYDNFEKFLKYFHGRTYANGRAKVRARILIPIHFGINEVGKDEFLKDLKGFSCPDDLYKLNKKNRQHVAGPGLKRKIFKMYRWIRRIFPMIKKIEWDKIEDSGMRAKEDEIGNHFIGSFYPMGWMEDHRYDDGSEIV